MKKDEHNIKYDMDELSKIFSTHSKFFKEEFSKRKEEYLKNQKENGNTHPLLPTDDFNLAEAMYCIVEEIKNLSRLINEKN